MDLLSDARARIDAVDHDMARLFAERMAAVADVARYKAEHGLPVLDAAREAEVIARNTALLADEALRPYYEQYLRMQMAVSRQYQAAVLARDRVAYQGVEGAFAHIALRRLFPTAKAVGFPTWEDVFDAVEQGNVEYGVLPFENSTAGDVSQVLDLCYTHRLFVVQMYDLPIEQNLLGLPGATLAEIRTVYSHAQALGQSERFIKSLGLESMGCPNTAVAAKFVAESGDRSKAAIASRETAALYGLKVLAEGVNSEGENTTRFIVVGRRLEARGNRVSLLFTVDNKVGRLARVLDAIGAAGFNMVCIKSRPMPHTPFEYYFYAELEAQPDNESLDALTAELDGVCRTLRILGIFHR